MYVPAHFSQQDREEILSFLHRHPFGMMVDVQEGLPVASHIPFIIEETTEKEFVLTAHVARANPQWKLWDGSRESLAVFTGAHSYVSSSWYEKVNVSTWNFQAVHVYGKARVMSGAEFFAFLSKLTQKYESGQKSPLYMEAMPQDYVKNTIKGAVGFVMRVSRVEAKWKLSQNRTAEDRENIIRELSGSDDPQAKAVAEEMRRGN